jgi:hypothetical protein
MLDLYKKHNVSKEYTSIGLFRAVREKYHPQRVLYPGSYVHITPSLVFPEVAYVDSFRGTNKFYESAEVSEYVDKNKEYDPAANYVFYHQDYADDLPEELESFDLVISQYGGFVGQAVKKYLCIGGLLVCNNSHGDASMASIDPGYELVAVYNRKSDEKFSISDECLCDYLIPKKEGAISREDLQKSMKGIGYTKSPSGYIFRKVY